MIELMQEALSDDLWGRYDDVPEDDIISLINEWNKDIGKFKEDCIKLGLNEKKVKELIDEIITAGCSYLEIDKQKYELMSNE